MIRVQVHDNNVQALLRRLQSAMDDMQPAMDEIGSTINDHIRLGFKSSTDPWGTRWKPLSEIALKNRALRFLQGKTQSQLKTKRGKWRAHILRRISQFADGKPLLDTGRLRNSITHNAKSNSVEIGTNVVYAPIHQFGGRSYLKRRAKLKDNGKWPEGEAHTHLIPARPFLPIYNDRADLPASWMTDVVGIIQSRLAQATR